MSTLNAHLRALVADLCAELPEVTERRMFGSDAFFANTNIYAMVWDGRILLRFGDEPRFQAARSLKGCDLFDPMGTGKTMGKWVVMPESMNDDLDALRPWLEEAHQLAMREPPRKKKPKAKPATAPRGSARRTGSTRAAPASRAAPRRGSRSR